MRVLVVEPHTLIRAGLAAVVDAEPGLEVVGQACDGVQATALGSHTEADVALVDVKLDRVVDTVGALASRPGLAVLLLTEDVDDPNLYAALCAGAAGVLHRQSAPERLLAAIYTVAAGEMLLMPCVARSLVAAYVEQRARPHRSLPDLRVLTVREAEVLRLVASGLPNARIAARLVVSEATVKTHLHRIMTKLNLSDRAQAVVLAYETGLVAPRRQSWG